MVAPEIISRGHLCGRRHRRGRQAHVGLGKDCIDHFRRREVEAEVCGNACRCWQTDRDSNEVVVVANGEIVRGNADRDLDTLALWASPVHSHRRKRPQKLGHVARQHLFGHGSVARRACKMQNLPHKGASRAGPRRPGRQRGYGVERAAHRLRCDAHGHRRGDMPARPGGDCSDCK